MVECEWVICLAKWIILTVTMMRWAYNRLESMAVQPTGVSFWERSWPSWRRPLRGDSKGENWYLSSFGFLWLGAHNMKSPYQCPRTDLHFCLCFLRKDWHDKSTIYRDGCIQHTELCVKIPLISTFSPSSLIPLTILEMEWTTIAESSAGICNLITFRVRNKITG